MAFDRKTRSIRIWRGRDVAPFSLFFDVKKSSYLGLIVWLFAATFLLALFRDIFTNLIVHFNFEKQRQDALHIGSWFAVSLVTTLMLVTDIRPIERFNGLQLGRQISASLILKMLLGIMSCIVIAASSYLLVTYSFGETAVSIKKDIYIQSIDEIGITPIMFLSVVIVMPFFEEFLFRGWLFAKLSDRGCVRLYPLISVFMFGLGHAGTAWIKIFTTMALAGLCCWLYVKTRGLLMPFLAHAINNALVLALSSLDF